MTQLEILYCLCKVMKKPSIQAELMMGCRINYYTFKTYTQHLKKCGLVEEVILPYKNVRGVGLIVDLKRGKRWKGKRKHYKLTDKGKTFLKLMDDAVAMLSEQKG